MAKGRNETPEQIASELNIQDFDPTNDRDRTFIGIISKLRSKNRELQGSLDSVTAEKADLESEIGDFRKTSKEAEIINSVLGDKKVIGDQAKFDKWKAKLTGSDSWEEDLKELVSDFAVDKSDDKGQKKTTTPPANKTGTEQKKEEGKGTEEQNNGTEEQNKGGAQKREFKGGGTQEMRGTAIRAPRTPSERLRMAAEDPEGYDSWRADNGKS